MKPSIDSSRCDQVLGSGTRNLNPSRSHLSSKLKHLQALVKAVEMLIQTKGEKACLHAKWVISAFCRLLDGIVGHI